MYRNDSEDCMLETSQDAYAVVDRYTELWKYMHAKIDQDGPDEDILHAFLEKFADDLKSVFEAAPTNELVPAAVQTFFDMFLLWVRCDQGKSPFGLSAGSPSSKSTAGGQRSKQAHPYTRSGRKIKKESSLESHA